VIVSLLRESGEILAESCVWWSWDHELIRRALQTALLEHWLPGVDRALRDNASGGRPPSTWDELAAILRRNTRNIRRTKAGVYTPTHGFFLGVAAIFGLPVRQFIPDTADWLAAATWELCGASVSVEEARCYVASRLTGLAGASRNGAAAEKSVRKVVAHLGAVLESIDKDMRKREG